MTPEMVLPAVARFSTSARVAASISPSPSKARLKAGEGVGGGGVWAWTGSAKTPIAARATQAIVSN
jgi:hypothetical protein